MMEILYHRLRRNASKKTHYTIHYGNKKAAQQFQTTVKTVRKWRKRWEKKGLGSKTCLKNLKKSVHDEDVLVIQVYTRSC